MKAPSHISGSLDNLYLYKKEVQFKVTSLLELPIDVIKIIFSYLSGFDLVRLAKVSKQFKMLTDDRELWKRMYLDRFSHQMVPQSFTWKQAYFYRKFGLTREFSELTLDAITIEENQPICFFNDEFFITRGPLKIYAAETGICLISKSEINNPTYHYHDGFLLAFSKRNASFKVFHLDFDKNALELAFENHAETCLFCQEDKFITYHDTTLTIRNLKNEKFQETIALPSFSAISRTMVKDGVSFRISGVSWNFLTLIVSAHSKLYTLVLKLKGEMEASLYNVPLTVIGDYGVPLLKCNPVIDLKKKKSLKGVFADTCKFSESYLFYKVNLEGIDGSHDIMGVYDLKKDKLIKELPAMQECVFWKDLLFCLNHNMKSFSILDFKDEKRDCAYNICPDIKISRNAKLYTNGKVIVVEEAYKKKIFFPGRASFPATKSGKCLIQ